MQGAVHLLEEIRALEEKLHRPEIRASRTATSELLAEGFLEFGSSGTVYRRDEIIDLLEGAGGAADFAGLSSSDYELRCLSADVALLTYRTTRLPVNGDPVRHVLRSSLWQYIDNRWQMVFHQGTPTTPAI